MHYPESTQTNTSTKNTFKDVKMIKEIPKLYIQILLILSMYINIWHLMKTYI